MKLWAGRFSKEADKKTNDFNSSIATDSRMYYQDIEGSIAHATMLAAKGIISRDDGALICSELAKIRHEISNGELLIDPNAEDIHTFIEQTLTERIGSAGKRLHTGRSRNDQVALDVRLYLREQCEETLILVKKLIKALEEKGDEYADAIMPGYTHLQRAQPITFKAHLLAYIEMLTRDLGRIEDAKKRMNSSPLGSGALAGTTYPIDRAMTAEFLGFDSFTKSTLDGVADRDFCIELASALSICMVHLSRLCEEIILWCSWEFKFVELDDAFSTGSSIMPQKNVTYGPNFPTRNSMPSPNSSASDWLYTVVSAACADLSFLFNCLVYLHVGYFSQPINGPNLDNLIPNFPPQSGQTLLPSGNKC